MNSLVFAGKVQSMRGTNVAIGTTVNQPVHGNEGINMMQGLTRFLFPVVFFGSILWFTGCYTQLGTTRDEQPQQQPDEEYTSSPNDTTGDNYEQSYTDNYVDGDNMSPRYAYGFNYYYPTLAFAFSAYDPWYARYGGWYYYDPFVCGTYYPAVYAGGYPYWHNSGFSNYPHFPHNGYAYGGRGHRGTTRTIGSTRGGGVVRGMGRDDGGGYRPATTSSGIDAAPAYKTSSGTRGNAGTPRVSTGRQNVGRSQATTRPPGVRGGTTRSGTRRGSHSTQPRTYTPSPGNGGGDRGSARSYSPPQSTPPAQSTPPSGTGRSSGSSGGSRGTRGR